MAVIFLIEETFFRLVLYCYFIIVHICFTDLSICRSVFFLNVKSQTSKGVDFGMESFELIYEILVAFDCCTHISIHNSKVFIR